MQIKSREREREREREKINVFFKFDISMYRKWSTSLTLVVTYGEVSCFSWYTFKSIEQLREDCKAFQYVALAKSLQIHFSNSRLAIVA